MQHDERALKDRIWAKLARLAGWIIPGRNGHGR